VVLPLFALLILGIAWEGSVHLFKIPKFMFPALSVIWVEFMGRVDLFLEHTLATLWTVFVGFLLSIGISVPLAIMIASSSVMANAIYPLLVLTQSVPRSRWRRYSSSSSGPVRPRGSWSPFLSPSSRSSPRLRPAC
jgi:NitT/TauT family transport system permease protein